MGFEIELRQDGSTLTIPSDDILDISLPNEHSVVNEWEATVPHSPTLEDWTYADAFVFYENASQNISRQLVYRGEFEVPVSQESKGTTTLRGKDVTRKLMRGGASVTYQNIPYWEASKDYWNNYTNFAATVTKPTADTVDTGKVVQDTAATGTAMADIFSPTGTDPFIINANGELALADTCFTQEGESGSFTFADTFGRTDFSGGQVARIDSNGEAVEWTFTPQFDIKAGDFRLFMRWEASSAQQINITVNGDTWVGVNDGSGAQLGWREFAYNPASSSTEEYEGPDFTGGTTYTVRLEAVTSNTGQSFWDVIAPADGRFNYTLDNDNGGSSGYLDGPETKPDGASLAAASVSSTFNIEAATIETTVDNTTGAQALQASNDGGTNYYPNDGTQTNTQTVTADFDANNSYGTRVHGYPTLDRYGSRTTATPQTGFKSQLLSAWKLSITTNDLAVIDNREFTGSHYENLQKLHDSWGRFVPEHAENSLPVESFETGAKTKTADWTRTDLSRTTPDGDYANSVTVWGAKDGSGNRLKAVAKDQDAINADGEEIEAPPIFRTEIDTANDLKSLARTALTEHLGYDDLTGAVDIWPKLLDPGYSYTVPGLDSTTLPLERVEFVMGAQGGRGRLDFKNRQTMAATIGGIQASVSSVKDAF